MQIHNTRHLIISASDYRINQMRLNALFLSKVFDDGQTMRKLIHNRSPLAEPILDALIQYHENKNLAQLYKKIETITTDEYGGLRKAQSCFFMMGFTNEPKYKNHPYTMAVNNDYVSYLKDGKSTGLPGFNPSDWLDTKLYDEPCSYYIQDRNLRPESNRQYTNTKPIDVLKETLEMERSKLREKPQTQNPSLDITLSHLFNNQEINETALTKALNLFNQDLIKAFSAHGPLTYGHFDALNLLTDKSASALEGIDYQRQRTFYQSDLCSELVKFSYLTTFTKTKDFDNSDFENHLFEVKNAGNWILGGHLIANKITANSTDMIGLNNNLITLATVRPLQESNSLPILKRYHQEDTLRIAQNYINLETQFYRKRLLAHD